MVRADMDRTAVTRSTCCYCGTGCGVLIHHHNGQILGVEGDPEHPANFGHLCTKGSTLHLTTGLSTRALYPEWRAARDEQRRRIDWDTALDTVADRFAAIIREHGPDAVAFYLSGQLLTEDYYVFNKLARALVGTHNIDSNSRLCMSSAASAYTRTLGADAPPCSYEDFEHADCVLITGANPAFAHPILFRRLADARAARPAQRWIVVDPRTTDTAAAADLHLAIEPGTDTVLLGAMLHVLIWEGLIDGRYIARHTAGFEAARDAVRDLTPAAAAAICGVPAADIVQAARWFGEAGNALSLWCQGLNQSHHGSDNGAALIHLHLATGQIGRPGAGPFSLTGQPNAMGGREAGAMATLLAGHRELANLEHCAEVAAYWGIPALPENPGRTATQIVDGLHDGSIKAVWIACTNPAQSLPDQAKVRAALSRAEFVVLQDAYSDTETAPFADLLLPATTWGEKEGVVTNSERRISRVRAAVLSPGEARADWRIARDVALRLGERLGRADALRLFDFETTAQVFAEHAGLTAGRDLDHAALTHAILERDGPQQWPWRDGQGQARLYADGRFATPDGQARFVPIALSTTAEKTSARYPLHLNSVRLRDQWHGMSRTGKLARLYSHSEQCALQLAPGDLARRGWQAGDLVRVASARGSIVLPVQPDPAQKPGHACLPMHWGRRRLAHGAANELLADAVDPFSKQPELKHAAVRLEKAELPWRGVALALLDGDAANALSAALAPYLDQFAYAAQTQAGRERALVVLHLAHEAAPAAATLAALEVLFGVGETAADIGRFDDGRRGIRKRARLAGDELRALTLFGECAAAGWLRDAMLSARSAAEYQRWLFAPLAQAPITQVCRGRILCNCLDIAEADIQAAVAAGIDTVDGLKAKLGCGTGCGGCLPEIGRLLRERAVAVASSG